MAANRAAGFAGERERGQIGRDRLGPGRQRIEATFVAPAFELSPVAGIGVQRIGSLGIFAVDPCRRDLASNPCLGASAAVIGDYQTVIAASNQINP